MNKDEILDVMKEFYEYVKKPKLPKNMSVNEKESVCEITLDAKCVKEKNMQEACNAFEGWSIVLYTALTALKDKNMKIRLCLNDYSEKALNKTSGHLARFLYRAERFNEQYTWFELSDELNKVLEKKAEVFRKGNIIYTNNIPEGEAGIKKKHYHESKIEAKLAEKAEGVEGSNLSKIIGNKMDFGSNTVNRQLPVGLFRNEVKKENSVFTGGKSAIDLWSWNNDMFHVIELKTLNPMIGIITEIFFYTNYMRDLLVKKTFTLNEGKGDRGYDILKKCKEIKKINGIMLADKYHPILEDKTKEILDVMNDNQDAGIHYYKIDYAYTYTLEVFSIK